MDRVGEQALFFWRALVWAPRALVHYKKEVLRLIAEISMGTGALAVIGGTVVIVGFLTLFTGGTIAVQGFSSLGNIGVEALTGFFAAFINVRIAAPVIAGIGTGGHHRRGLDRAARCDACLRGDRRARVDGDPVGSVSGVDPRDGRHDRHRPAVLARRDRVVRGQPVRDGVPLRPVTRCLRPLLLDLPEPTDILWSFAQAIAMALAVMLIHTYYGFNASGGPVGVGVAVGNAVRASLIAVVTVTLLISLAIYGQSGNFNLSG